MKTKDFFIGLSLVIAIIIIGILIHHFGWFIIPIIILIIFVSFLLITMDSAEERLTKEKIAKQQKEDAEWWEEKERKRLEEEHERERESKWQFHLHNVKWQQEKPEWELKQQQREQQWQNERKMLEKIDKEFALKRGKMSFRVEAERRKRQNILNSEERWNIIWWNLALLDLIIKIIEDNSPNSLGEAIKLIEDKIPKEILRKLTYLNDTRNRACHDYKFDVNTILSEYIEMSADVYSYLNNNLTKNEGE